MATEKKIAFVEGIACFAKIAQPAKKYQSEELEFSIDVVVPKTIAKEWNKTFKKQPAKVVDTSDFEGIYKIEPPFSEEDEQYIIKLKKPASYKDGTKLDKKYWPKILVQNGDEAEPIAEGILVANGSKVKVSYEITSNDFGTFGRLKNVLVTDLIEYSASGSNAGSEFGLKVKAAPKSEFEDDSEEPAKEAPKVETKAKPAKKPPVQQDDDEEDAPF
jgi:hypothetical protein